MHTELNTVLVSINARLGNIEQLLVHQGATLAQHNATLGEIVRELRTGNKEAQERHAGLLEALNRSKGT